MVIPLVAANTPSHLGIGHRQHLALEVVRHSLALQAWFEVVAGHSLAESIKVGDDCQATTVIPIKTPP